MSAAIASAALLALNLMAWHKTAKVLEVGTAILFGVLAACACFGKAAWPVAGIHLCVDAGLLLVVFVSIAIRQPFTLQYAREQVASDWWDKPEFVRANYVITAVWVLAFAVMTATDMLLLYTPTLPAGIGNTVTVAAIIGAVCFTSWYPRRAARK